MQMSDKATELEGFSLLTLHLKLILTHLSDGTIYSLE